MPPVLNVTCQPITMTTEELANLGKDDLNALLYIVVTLLFYSMGIIIGIITYLKREQADMEEDKLFDMYLQLKREPFDLQKKEQVQQMSLHLKKLEEQKDARLRIENWNMSDQKQIPLHHQPCRRHHYRHFSCPDCKKSAQEASFKNADEAAGAVPGSDLPERGASAALLCSLTLGACEPLLTHDVLKRVTFPHSPASESRNLPVSIRPPSASVSQSRQCGKNDSAFKHSSLAVHAPLKGAAVLEYGLTNERHGNETKVPFLNMFQPASKDGYVPNMFNRGDIELMELQRFHHGRNSDIQKTPASYEKTPNAWNRLSWNDPVVSSLAKQNKPLARYPSPTMQSCLKQEGKSSDLTVYVPLERTSFVSVGVQFDSTIPLTDNICDENGRTKLRQLPTNAVIMEESAVEGMVFSQDTGEVVSDNFQQQQQQGGIHQQPTEPIQGEEHQYWHEPPSEISHPSLASPSSVQLSDDASPPLRYHWPLPPLPLSPPPPQQQRQHTHPDDVISKTFPRTNTHRSLNEHDNSKESSADGILPQYSQYQLYHPWKKSSSQNFDIPDFPQTHKIGLDWKSKSVDKKHAPRNQPDRRGALFFTQRPLHKEQDSPKSSSGQKQSTSADIYSRQESEDPHNSRMFETPGRTGSPIVKSASDTGSNSVSGLNISSTSSPTGFTPLSPPASSKHQRRIPRLVKSQTIDPSRLSHK